MERIILSPSIGGGELTKSLALNGVNVFNTRFMGSGELARYVLMRSGIIITDDFINTQEELSIIATAIQDETYFNSSSYSDIREIASAIRCMRCLVSDNKEEQLLKETLEKGIFTEKNAAILSVYHKYISLLNEQKKIDSVSLIRKAISEGKPFEAEFLVLDEYPLSPLERKLISTISGDNYSSACLKDLFNASERSISISSIKNCYGASNEVETIINDIYSDNKLDQCTVAVTDIGTYSQLFFDYSLINNIPITFGCGLPIINSNPARLLALYNHWMTTGFFGATAIKRMIFSDFFDRNKLIEVLDAKDIKWKIFYELLGDIRLTNNYDANMERIADFRKAVSEDSKYIVPGESKEYDDFLQKQKCLPLLEIMAEELSMPVEVFIAKYSILRQSDGSVSGNLIAELDRVAVRSLYEDLKVIRTSGTLRSESDAITTVLKTNVMNQRSAPCCIHITSIEKAHCTIRDNLYIAGLSSSKYPGSPKENYLLLDSDIKLFGPDAEYLTSTGRIVRKRDSLLNLVSLASSLGSKVFLSYSGLNVSELKRDNPSSMIFELYSKAHPDGVTSRDLEAETVNVAYFDPAISASRLIGKAYIDDKFILQKEPVYSSPKAVWNIDKEYSPTAIETFLGCPRSFMIGYVLGIPEPDESDDFEIISARDSGTLAHSLMEQLADNNMSLEDFLQMSAEFFDRYITEHPSLIPEKIGAERESFSEMMENAYKSDPHREVVLKEEDIHCVHPTGVKLHGYPDRVEKLEDGSLLIVDFKTGRQISHTEDDIYSCLQIVIYAYLMESKGYKVSGGEYRYIRLNKSVSCKYDEEMKDKLSELLNTFKDMMENGYFPCGLDCTFCKYDSICGRSSEDNVFAPTIMEEVSDE